MRIEILSNKSVCVIGTLIHEYDTVASFRQFGVGDKVQNNGKTHTVLYAETIVHDNVIQNIFTLSSVDMETSVQVTEWYLLADTPRPCPANIFDVLADVLPKTMLLVDTHKANEMREML